MSIQTSGASQLYPIIGDPVRYTESPRRLSETFAHRGHDGVCVPLQVPATALKQVMDGLSAALNVAGILVTMPHKAAVADYCATRSERADRLGVVSVLRRNHDGSWHGDMLDGLAFVKAQVDHGAQPAGARVLLIGAGGAGSAIAAAMLEADAAEVAVYDTDSSRAAAVVDQLNGLGNAAAVASANPTGFDLICNATPLGMNDDDPLPLDTSTLKRSMFVGDVIAGHGTTPLIEAARSIGCRTASGGDMVAAVQEVMADFYLAD